MQKPEPTLARDLPDALRMLAQSRVSGVVTIEGADGKAQLTMADGKIVFATSSRTPPLGRVLVDKRLITAETLKGVLRLQEKRDSAHPIGTVLYELGLLTGRIADDEIALHIARIVHQAISWRFGSFAFQEEPVQTTGILASECLGVERILLQVQLMEND
ncbi:MAG: DUF4388 domain-containing protein [Planctomycetota bacterium]